MQENSEHFFNSLGEPYRSCLLFLHAYILNYSEHIEVSRKNNTPFYYHKKKWLCFLSYHPVSKEIYISFANGYKIEHPKLLSEGRKKMKIIRIDANKDIDVKSLSEILQLATK